MPTDRMPEDLPEKSTERNEPEPILGGLWLVVLACFALAIFISSSFVIRSPDLVQQVKRRAWVDEGIVEQVRAWWLVWWYPVVKGWHVTEFALLTLMGAWGLRAVWPSLGKWAIGLAMMASIAYAIGDELHQSYVPERHGRFTDVLFDACGVLIAGAILYWGEKLLRNNEEPEQTVDSDESK